jgi:uncharacterized protein
MTDRQRVVVDTNVLVSRLLLPDSIPGQALRKAVDVDHILVSEATMAELASVLSRPKFDPYITIKDRQEFLRLLGRLAEHVPITYTVHACRDSKDNMILEVAVNGSADVIVTGDQDLLALGTFHEIPIITPAIYVAGWRGRS